jgi:hypothetical protein
VQWQDKKLQLLLGDQQKEFQGCTISTEKLGSKFGGYGTFLPTQARAPSMFANPLPPPHALEPTSVLAEGNLEVMELPFSFMCNRWIWKGHFDRGSRQSHWG